MNCRYVHTNLPRLVCHQRHERGEWCEECSACPESHCRVCNREHLDQLGACGQCLTEVRDNLAEITNATAELSEEVEHRGVDSEAMNLLGPATDPEAWGHRTASALSGRIILADCDARDLDDLRAWLDKANSETHPLWTISTWAMAYRDAFEHDEPSGAVVLAHEVGYLNRNLTYAATWPDVPFEDFARDLRRCVAHMESVLHDSEQGERTNIDCLDCGAALERKLSDRGFEDVTTCRGCKRRYKPAEYQQAVKNAYIDKAEWLGDADMATRTGVNPDTVRSWARAPKDDSPPLVRKTVQDGRTVYLVEDVERVAREKGLAA